MVCIIIIILNHKCQVKNDKNVFLEGKLSPLELFPAAARLQAALHRHQQHSQGEAKAERGRSAATSSVYNIN